MRFVDIIMDIDWYNANAKSLGSPRARAKRRAIGHDIDVELLIYGDERKFRHLRVLIGSDDPQVADAVHSDNLDFWLSMYEIASATGQGTFSKPATIPGTDAYMVVSDHGDETAPGVSFDVSGVAVPTINYEAVETLTRCRGDAHTILG